MKMGPENLSLGLGDVRRTFLFYVFSSIDGKSVMCKTNRYAKQCGVLMNITYRLWRFYTDEMNIKSVHEQHNYVLYRKHTSNSTPRVG